jgi:predicted nucleic acid-binding protein
MRLCVLDSSFALAWVFADEQNDLADTLQEQLFRGDSVVVPAVLWGLEVRNALRTAVRRQRMTVDQAEERRLLLAQVPRISVAAPAGLGNGLDRIMRAHGLTSYDAVYLAVALEQALPLATADEDLRAAAAAAGVRPYAG